MTTKEAIEIIECAPQWDRESKDAIRMAIEALKAQDQALNEWCTDCKEYDHEKHCCPRFNRVIKSALEDVTDTNVGDMVSRQDVIELVKDSCYNLAESMEDTWAMVEDVERLPSADSELINKLDFGINASTGDSDYMVGLRNGLRLAKAYVDGSDPQFEECAEPKTGRWIPMKVSSGRDSWKCSVCGRRARGKLENLPYCHCGAKMLTYTGKDGGGA